MKKNKMMRIASALLVATLLTTSVISGTFAKYTTKSTGTDSARVAKWGFQDTSSITLSDLFKNAYDSTVKSTTDVIAPGTEGEAKFKFDYTEPSATPEVAYTFVVDTTGSKCDQSIQNNENIQWKLDDGQWGTWSQMITAIEALDGDKVEDTDAGTPANYYAPNTLPTAFNGSNEHTVAWRWVFDKDAADSKVDRDAQDTEMGNAATLANVELHINITATQVD